jgi:hypothetical protein
MEGSPSVLAFDLLYIRLTHLVQVADQAFRLGQEYQIGAYGLTFTQNIQ